MTEDVILHIKQMIKDHKPISDIYSYAKNNYYIGTIQTFMIYLNSVVKE